MRIIAHSDANCFYASVEMLRNPRLRDVPMAVCGSTEERHGIVLTANYIAKRRGVRTGMAAWQARQTCPGLISVPPKFTDYIQFSGFLRKIYSEYTDRVEGFGLDEAWLDLGACASSFDDGENIVDELRERVKRELGITVSVGLSDNKVFAKLGSDLRKPDACTVIRPESFKETVWQLPAGALLYVGRATEAKLASKNIKTIGDLANVPPSLLARWFGKVGGVLHAYANGLDRSPVADIGYEPPVKSVGNSHTCPRDLKTDQDVKIVLYALSESVGARMMELGVLAHTVEFSYCTGDMTRRGVKQRKAEFPTCVSGEIADAAYFLFKQCYGHWPQPLRKIGVRGCDLVSAGAPRQLSLFESPEKTQSREDLERALNSLRSRFGNKSVQRGIMFLSPELSGVDAKRDHTIHPVGLFRGGMGAQTP